MAFFKIFILMFLISDSHGLLQLSTDIRLPYAVSSHFLMCPQCMPEYMESEVLYQLQSFDVPSVCVASYGRIDVVPMMVSDSF